MTFEPQNSGNWVSQGQSLYKFEHFWIIRFSVMLRTNRQTDKQTDGLENPTHTDRHTVVGAGNIFSIIYSR